MAEKGEIIDLEQILPDAYYQKITLIQMYTVEIKKEIASEAIILTKSYVDNQLRNDYSHVKRCRQSKVNDNHVEIVMGPSKDIPSTLLNDLKKLNKTENIPVNEIQVSKFAPLTKQQYSAGCKYWPLYFKVPSYIGNNSCLTDAEIKKSIYFLNYAIRIGKTYGTCSSGCVLTYKDRIIACSGDNSQYHPLQHAAILALEHASYKIREVLRLEKLLKQLGSYNIEVINKMDKANINGTIVNEKENKCICGAGRYNTSQVEKPKLKKQKKGENKGNKNEAKTKKEQKKGEKINKETKEKKGKKKDEKGEGEEEEEERNDDTKGDPYGIIEQLKTYEPLTSDQYLCTNYFAYLSHEPCLMCAMALLHSRVTYVIFDQENKKNGAVFSKVKLHLVKNLNHHYKVYKAKRKK